MRLLLIFGSCWISDFNCATVYPPILWRYLLGDRNPCHLYQMVLSLNDWKKKSEREASQLRFTLRTAIKRARCFDSYASLFPAPQIRSTIMALHKFVCMYVCNSILSPANDTLLQYIIIVMCICLSVLHVDNNLLTLTIFRMARKHRLWKVSRKQLWSKLDRSHGPDLQETVSWRQLWWISPSNLLPLPSFPLSSPLIFSSPSAPLIIPENSQEVLEAL